MEASQRRDDRWPKRHSVSAASWRKAQAAHSNHGGGIVLGNCDHYFAQVQPDSVANLGKIDKLFAIGEGGGLIAQAAQKAGMKKEQILTFQEGSDELVALILADLRDNDVVLIKASRALRLDEVADNIATKIGSIN